MSFHISRIMHASSYKTLSEMLNAEFISKRLRNMGDRWKAWLSAMENVQEKFIREMEEQLAKLTNLFEDMTVHPRGPSLLPNQQVHRPFVQTMSYLPRRTDRPSLRQPMPTAPPAFVAMADLSINQAAQGANLANKRRSGEGKTNGIQSPSLMLSCFQS